MSGLTRCRLGQVYVWISLSWGHTIQHGRPYSLDQHLKQNHDGDLGEAIVCKRVNRLYKVNSFFQHGPLCSHTALTLTESDKADRRINPVNEQTTGGTMACTE